MGPPCTIREESDRIRFFDGGWVRRGPVVRQTPEYQSTLAEWWKRQECDKVYSEVSQKYEEKTRCCGFLQQGFAIPYRSVYGRKAYNMCLQ
ncbi:hypothetical protein Y032_0894g2913 [Ancylostoma ceylanicum]|uniref:Uncharacterized protein n=1 Tax=Ancylostoma ceylanicum TaxID=53326 RepID=A0A016WB06_9BILA|nr:hypothetical protein Y032_0894g2913 [Ancylostoma ceylanicum]EYC36457.1 hypothetical protein Y032_0894g2913 [Ancylostoma ceylanicum]